mmetsp:Transcript_5774/g.17038  ORF Transcript_5774/g.17038 Transcript_5774/m.17038 type:complete len:236 (+) Transcript_5774:737-1444(+)
MRRAALERIGGKPPLHKTVSRRASRSQSRAHVARRGRKRSRAAVDHERLRGRLPVRLQMFEQFPDVVPRRPGVHVAPKVREGGVVVVAVAPVQGRHEDVVQQQLAHEGGAALAEPGDHQQCRRRLPAAPRVRLRGDVPAESGRARTGCPPTRVEGGTPLDAALAPPVVVVGLIVLVPLPRQPEVPRQRLDARRGRPLTVKRPRAGRAPGGRRLAEAARPSCARRLSEARRGAARL